MREDTLPTAGSNKNGYKGMLQENQCNVNKMQRNFENVSSWPQNSGDMYEFYKTISDQTDHESCGYSESQLHDEVDKRNCNCETQSLETSGTTPKEMSLQSANKNTKLVEDLIKGSSLPASEKTSCMSLDLLLDSTAESNSVSALLQPLVQSLPGTTSGQTSSDRLPHFLNVANAMPVESKSSLAHSGIGVEAQVTCYGTTSSSGARPKLTAVRTSKKNKTRNTKKNVQWCEEIKYISNIDAESYEQYRRHLLELSIPETGERNAATGAVFFMSDKNKNINLDLIIDMALKFLWEKHGRCPTAVMLYSAICDFKYEERNIVLAFHELCQTRTKESEVTNRQQNSSSCTEEPLKDLDLQIPAHSSHLQNSIFDFQPHDEGRFKHPKINKAANIKDNEMPDKWHNKLLTQKKFKHDQVKVLQTEHEYLTTRTVCVLCRKKQIEVTLLPCSHFVLCAACSENCNICPVCSKQALAEVKTFLC